LPPHSFTQKNMKATLDANGNILNLSDYFQNFEASRVKTQISDHVKSFFDVKRDVTMNDSMAMDRTKTMLTREAEKLSSVMNKLQRPSN